jgi:hypothetical protein
VTHVELPARRPLDAGRARAAESRHTRGTRPADVRGTASTPSAFTVLAVAATALWGTDIFLAPSVPDRVVLRSVALTVEILGAIALVGARHGRGYGLDRFRLGPWYLLLSAVSMGLASIVWRHPQPGDLAIIDRASVARALAILGMTIPLWTVGYLAGPGRTVLGFGRWLAATATAKKARGSFNPTAMWVLYGVSVAARVAQILLGQFGFLADPSQLVSRASGYANILATVGACGLSALVIAAVELARSGGARRWVAFLVLLTTEIAFGLLSGMKGQFAFTLLGVCASFAVVRGRLPLRWILGGAAILVLVVVPFTATYRDTVRSPDRLSLPVSAAVSSAWGILASTVGGSYSNGQASRGTLSDSTTYLTMRLREVDSLAVVVQETPRQVPFRSLGELVTSPILGLVPRALWPNKPVRTAGYTFNQQYFGTSPGMYTSAGISPQADLYRYGGLIAVLIGSVILGACLRLVDETLHPSLDLRLTALYISLFTLLLTLETPVTDLLVALPIKLGVMVLVCRFVYSGHAARPAARCPASSIRWH